MQLEPYKETLEPSSRKFTLVQCVCLDVYHLEFHRPRTIPSKNTSIYKTQTNIDILYIIHKQQLKGTGYSL